MTKHFGSTVAAFLALATFNAGSSAIAAAADAAGTIRYAVDDEHNINELPREIAEREGFFAREGLKVEIVRFTPAFRTSTFTGAVQPRENPTQAAGGATSTREAMEKGLVDMTRVQFGLHVAAVMAGGKNIAVAVKVQNPGYFLVARPEIRSFADLRGKTVSITGPTDGITIWTRKLNALHGLPNDGVTLKAITGSADRVACLRTMECAASSLGQPALYEALDAGFHVLGNNNEVAPVMYLFDTANPVWAAAHRDLVVKFIRAQTAASRFAYDPRNREEVVKVTTAYMNVPEKMARDMVAYITEPRNRVLPQQAAIDMNGIRASISLLAEYGLLRQPLPAPERFVDPTYAAAAGP